jgi:hypothetical protein
MKFRKRPEKDPLIRSKAEEYRFGGGRICKVRTRAVTAPRNSNRSRTPDRVRSPIRHQTPDPEASQDKGKTHAFSTTPTFLADHPMSEQLLTPPSKTTSTRDPRVSSGGRHSEQPAEKSPTPSPGIRKSVVSGTPGSRTPRAEETCDSEDEIAPSPNMRRALTRG